MSVVDVSLRINYGYAGIKHSVGDTQEISNNHFRGYVAMNRSGTLTESQ